MTRNSIVCAALVPALAAVLACGGDKAPEATGGGTGGGTGGAAAKSAGGGSTATSGKKDWDASKGTAKVTGVVKFEGKPPRRRTIDVSKEDYCVEHTKDAPLVSETVIVNEDGSLRNVFVWVKKGLRAWKFPVPKEPVIIDQRGCRYSPHVFGIRAKQTLEILNSDPVTHNIRCKPKLNKEFNFSQSTKGQKDKKSFRRTEVCVKMSCDMHTWMNAYVGVVPHPFFAVTGDKGSFALEGLPPGSYTIEAWHEKYGTQTAEVTLADAGAEKLTFTFKKK